MISPTMERKTETLMSWSVLLCLFGIGLGVFLKQYSFNPAVLVAHRLATAPGAVARGSGMASEWLPAGVKEFGAPEQFKPENLYDKIDGKAELYVSAGISGMDCQRFALKDAPDSWFEWFCYRMNGAPEAFSVFSMQRRAEGQPLELTPYAYRTQNALYFAAGSNYVEAVGSSASDPLMSAMLEMARHFVAANGADTAQMGGMNLLPSHNIVPASTTLQTSDAFGFDQFKNVFTARYNLNGGEAMAFVTSCASPEAAKALCEAYRKFLLENGGKETAAANKEPGSAIEIMGTFELVFCEGSIVTGVHSAPTLPSATELASMLKRRLEEQTR